MQLVIGQKLWFVGAHSYNSGGHDVVVEKIGRKWAALDSRYRIDIKTLWADGAGYTSPGRCWLSEQHWIADQKRRGAWSELKKAVDGWDPPDHISEATIRQAISLISGPSEP